MYKACIVCARLVPRILGKNGIELGKTGTVLGNWCYDGQRGVSWRVQYNKHIMMFEDHTAEGRERRECAHAAMHDSPHHRRRCLWQQTQAVAGSSADTRHKVTAG